MLPRPQKLTSGLALITLFIFIIIRLVGILSRPIWYDEAFSILLAEQGPAGILSGTLTADFDSSAAEEHPPAYYFLLWGWLQLFGNSLISIRLLSVILSLGVLVLIYLIANHLFEKQTAFAAALLATILPFQIHYGQEIRMYVLLTFWLSLTTLAFLKRQWILFSLAAALAQYTHNLAAFYLIPLAITPVFQRDWKTFRTIALAGFAAIGIYSPWLIHLPAQLAKVTSSFWIEKPGIGKLFTLFLLYLPHLPLPNSLLVIGLLFATLIITLAAFQTYLAQNEKSPQAKSGLWLAYLSFMPPLLLWLVSQVSPIYVERALLPSHAIFCIWLAWVLMQKNLPRLIQAFVLFLILASAVMGIYQHLTYKGFPYTPAVALNQSIQTRMKSGDAVIHSNKLSYLPAFYFNRVLPQSFILDPINSNVDTLSPTIRNILNLRSFDSIESGTENASRIWFIIYKQSLDEFIQANQIHPQLEYLNKNFTHISTEKWDDIRLYLYTRNLP
jgi:mannosyltransferase